MSVAADLSGHLYIKCKGTNYEVGEQHGRLAKKQVANSIETYDKLYKETAGIDWKEARKRAESYVDHLEKVTPDLMEEMKGIAEGAEVDLIDIIALNVRSEIVLTQFSGGCTSVAQYDAEKKLTLVAQNWDWVPPISDSLIVLEIELPNKPKMIMISEAGIIAKYGLNSEGLACCLNAIKSGVSAMKLPVHLALRKIMESSSVKEAIAELEKYGVASTANYLMGDKTGNIVTVEATPRGIQLVEAVDNKVYHTNHLVHKTPLVEDSPALNSNFRYTRISEISQGQPCTIESFRSRLSDTKDSPGAICRSSAGSTGLDSCATLATIIMDVTHGKAELTFGKPDSNPQIHILTCEA